MNIESIYSSAAFWSALTFTCIALAAVGFALFPSRLRGRGQGEGERSKISLAATVAAFTLLLTGAGSTIWLSMRVLKLSGENLHLPLITALFVFGLIAGTLLAVLTRRVAFF